MLERRILVLIFLLIVIIVLFAHPGLCRLVEEDVLAEFEKIVKLWLLKLLL